jgi:hypothetical protein
MQRYLSIALRGTVVCDGCMVTLSDGLRLQVRACITFLNCALRVHCILGRRLALMVIHDPATQICETLPASGPVVVTSVTHVMVETAAGVLSAEHFTAVMSEPTSGAASTSEDDLRSRWDARHFDGNPALQSLFELIALPILRRRDFEALGVECPKGILLSGPPGVGKTWAVRTVVNKLGVKMISVDASNITGSGMAGDSEARLRDVFRQARSTGDAGSLEPCIIFIDEIDVLCGKRGGDGSSASGNRLVAQLLTLMDGLDSKTQNGVGGSSRIVVVGATNMPNAIDPALRRPGRFEREVPTVFDPPSPPSSPPLLSSPSPPLPPPPLPLIPSSPLLAS